MPPSHWVSWRHISTDREWRSNEISFSTVDPVVVNPLTDSNSALTGSATAPLPATRDGIVPTTGTISHVRLTNKNASRWPGSSSGRSRSSPRPSATMTALAARNGTGSSP